MKRVAPAWIRSELAALAAAHAAGRLPHALLIHEAPGAGGQWLAEWAAQLALCSNAEEQGPCGSCASCARVNTRQHPDVVYVHPIDDSRQIRIEQVRELSEELTLTSHQGGFKVGILSPADLLNRYAANALLKTLEEPPPRTLLVLVATQPSRLPATIISRCQRIRIRPPGRDEAVEWLQAVRGPADWNAVLDILGNAPLLAAEGDPAAIVQVGKETRWALDEAVAGRVDPVLTAERWARSDLALRLTCFENWLTERVRRTVDPSFSTGTRDAAHLPRTGAGSNIRSLLELVDGVRELKSALDTPINRSLALENLLRRLGPGGSGHA